ncbi:hypothetical protein [Nioella sediminis]|jgi:uncharacterized membrane protein YhaH (DUF805 family)|uniref:hypothetical protein n=1 Tax=Nioella sediminis TaxID=1912092 RepID=UPI0008FD0ACE|nr:hypothetical protein [Nioella sediminis]TBX28832.1 hypothetical protein TK43_03410 [Roseovarius sp. JS7-11]
MTMQANPPAPLPCYGQMMRRIIYALSALQAVLLAVAVLVSHRFAIVMAGQPLPMWMALVAGLALSALLVPALALAHSRAHQHLGMAMALTPLAGMAALSVYLN